MIKNGTPLQIILYKRIKTNALPAALGTVVLGGFLYTHIHFTSRISSLTTRVDFLAGELASSTVALSGSR